MANNKFKELVTAKAEFLFPNLKHTEAFDGKDTGKYTVTFRLPKDETERFEEILQAEWDKAYSSNEDLKGKTTKKGTVPNLGSMREDKNGDIVFKAKASAEIKTKTGDILKLTVPVFDAKGKPTDVEIGHGSIGKLAIMLCPYHVSSTNYGISLRLRGVQVLDLKEPGSSQDASALGFGEEDGYTVADDNQIENFGVAEDGDEDEF